jgi:hypothetical protein
MAQHHIRILGRQIGDCYAPWRLSRGLIVRCAFLDMRDGLAIAS